MNPSIIIFKKEDCKPCSNLTESLKDSQLPIGYYYIEDPNTLNLAEKFKIRKVPTVIFVDENMEQLKRLNGKIDGTIDKELIESTYNKLLNK